MRKSKSIFRKTFEPVLAILLILMGTYTIFIHQNVLTYLKENAFEVFKEQTVNCRDFMEGKMISQWSAIDENAERITELAEQITEENGKRLSDISTDVALNQDILMGITEEVIELLKTSGNTEVFLILDGVAISQKPESKAGIYIRNSSPGTYNVSNSSLLFERGVPAISKEYKISLDSFWKAAFYFDEGQDDYFFQPLEAARKSSNKNFDNFGYWSFGCPVDDSDKNVLTYSIPLIGSDGTVFGVMGVGVDENYFKKSIHSNSRESGKSRAYLLAKTTDGSVYEPVTIKGKAYSKTTFIGRRLTLKEEGDIGYLDFKDTSGARICANQQELNVYSPNTPFENETWVLLGVQQEDELLNSYFTAQKMLGVLLIGSVLVCGVCVLWFSRFISKPIQGMVKELHHSNPNRPICLKKVQVVEIDELAESIENLSIRVAAAYSKISKIIQMTDAGISVFEYKEKENLLFCNQELYEMMGWTPEIDSDEYVDGSSFKEQMKEWLMRKDFQSEQILEIPKEDGSSRWLKLTQIREEGSLLGVFTDITMEMLEKQKIKYERDYDVMTNLLNRRVFEERMESIFDSPWLIKNAVLLVWDLDNLKYVNDAYGHSIGDEYIMAFAANLRQMSGPGILSARRSGDEFVTFAYGYEDEKELRQVTEQIWEKAGQAEILLPDGRNYHVRVSMGKAWYPKDAADYRSMFEYADFAMYMVKHSRKGTMADFDDKVYRKNRILLRGQEAFNNLLENHLVKYMLQPIVKVEDGSIYGYEMLMRSALDAFQSPLDILRMAHSQSRLYDVEVMTWFEAMKCFVSKVEEGMCSRESKVFINSIANQVMSDEMLIRFEGIFQKYLPNIVCEFTEEEEENHQVTQRKLQYVRKWKGMTAIDDYGCGYNSEAILLNLSPDIVKIDISIVRGIHHDKDRQQLVANLVHYAKGRGIQVLGEGVENREEMETLIRLGVNLLQGYYIARPAYDAGRPMGAVCEEIRRIHSRM